MRTDYHYWLLLLLLWFRRLCRKYPNFICHPQTVFVQSRLQTWKDQFLQLFLVANKYISSRSSVSLTEKYLKNCCDFLSQQTLRTNKIRVLGDNKEKFWDYFYQLSFICKVASKIMIVSNINETKRKLAKMTFILCECVLLAITVVSGQSQLRVTTDH